MLPPKELIEKARETGQDIILRYNDVVWRVLQLSPTYMLTEDEFGMLEVWKLANKAWEGVAKLLVDPEAPTRRFEIAGKKIYSKTVKVNLIAPDESFEGAMPFYVDDQKGLLTNDLAFVGKAWVAATCHGTYHDVLPLAAPYTKVYFGAIEAIFDNKPALIKATLQGGKTLKIAFQSEIDSLNIEWEVLPDDVPKMCENIWEMLVQRLKKEFVVFKEGCGLKIRHKTFNEEEL